MEAAGTIYQEDGVWRLSSIVFGDMHAVEGPIPGEGELSYHVHLPHGGQICMPPSPQDWLVLLRNQLPVAYVISREGVYKFWWDGKTKNTVMNMGGTKVPGWIHEIESLGKILEQVHRGEFSIAEYKKRVSEYGMCMEFRSL